MADLLIGWARIAPEFFEGLQWSLALTACVIVIGYPLGLLLAVANMTPSRMVVAASRVVIELARGVPALVTLYVVYFGLPQIELRLPSFLAATAALAFTTGGYTSAIFKAGFISVESGQAEAGTSLALHPARIFWHVLLPQAFRNVVIPLVSWMILVFQATSLAFTVAVPELMSHAYSRGSSTYDYTTPLTLAGLMYAAVSMFVLLLIVATRSRRSRRTDRTPTRTVATLGT